MRDDTKYLCSRERASNVTFKANAETLVNIRDPHICLITKEGTYI